MSPSWSFPDIVEWRVCESVIRFRLYISPKLPTECVGWLKTRQADCYALRGTEFILLPIAAYWSSNVNPIRLVLSDGDNVLLPTLKCWKLTRTAPFSRGNSKPAPYVSPKLLAVPSEPRE